MMLLKRRTMEKSEGACGDVFFIVDRARVVYQVEYHIQS